MINTASQAKKQLFYDQKSFSAFYSKYHPSLSYEASRYISDRQVIEELINDVFLWLWEKQDELLITASIEAYLYRAIRNACFSFLRKERLVLVSLSSEPLDIREGIADASSPIDRLQVAELSEQFSKAIESLPRQCRQVYRLHRFREMSYQAIACEMGISVNTVKLHMKRALSHLRTVAKRY